MDQFAGRAARVITEWDNGPGNPDRALAECESKRAIIACCCVILDVTGWEYDDAPDLALTTLRMLALPYADHPDYDQDWRP